jgi:hypothetical protein
MSRRSNVSIDLQAQIKSFGATILLSLSFSLFRSQRSESPNRKHVVDLYPKQNTNNSDQGSPLVYYQNAKSNSYAPIHSISLLPTHHHFVSDKKSCTTPPRLSLSTAPIMLSKFDRLTPTRSLLRTLYYAQWRKRTMEFYQSRT